jgi:multidrug resistance efflux pump
MVFVGEKKIVSAQIQQIYLRHIQPGQLAELTFKMFPGEIFDARVELVVPATAQGQVTPSGILPAPRETAPGPFFVRLTLEDEEVAKRLPAGAVGTVAIYTGKMSAIYIIRRVMIGMDAWLNYVVPF